MVGKAARLHSVFRSTPVMSLAGRRSGLRAQAGVTITGLIVILAVVGVVAVLAMKVVPTYSEYMGARKAIEYAKGAGTNPAEIRAAFSRQAEVGYITSISGTDLDIVKDGDKYEVSFAYEKKIPLVGPANLLMEYSATTALQKGPAPKGLP